jgi:hypothetical protein
MNEQQVNSIVSLAPVPARSALPDPYRQIVPHALAAKGVPFRLGGRDLGRELCCSGLVASSAEAAGFRCPRLMDYAALTGRWSPDPPPFSEATRLRDALRSALDDDCERVHPAHAQVGDVLLFKIPPLAFGAIPVQYHIALISHTDPWTMLDTHPWRGVSERPIPLDKQRRGQFLEAVYRFRKLPDIAM